MADAVARYAGAGRDISSPPSNPALVLRGAYRYCLVLVVLVVSFCAGAGGRWRDAGSIWRVHDPSAAGTVIGDCDCGPRFPWSRPNGTAVIVEPRATSALTAAVQRAISGLPADWVILILHSPANREFVMSAFGAWVSTHKVRTYEMSPGAGAFSICSSSATATSTARGCGVRCQATVPRCVEARPVVPHSEEPWIQAAPYVPFDRALHVPAPAAEVASAVPPPRARRAWQFDTARLINGVSLSLGLYDLIPTDLLLMFQTDTVICGPDTARVYDFAQYDLVGAPWASNLYAEPRPSDRRSLGVGGNGGLSLRSKSAVVDVLSRHGDGGPYPAEMRVEDTYLSFRMAVLGKKLPPLDVARGFSVETLPHAAPYGVHKFWGHLSVEDQAVLLRGCPRAWEIMPQDARARVAAIIGALNVTRP